jgi:hypothetical protein
MEASAVGRHRSGAAREAETLVEINIDGKFLCATLRPYAKTVHLLAAVDHQTGYVLSQTHVDKKANEHKGGALDLLQNLVLKGRVVLSMRCFAREKFANKFSIRRATT